MSIVPNTTIRILKNIPLDNTYKDTLYFTSRSTQSTYFTNKTKYTLSNYTYQRQTKSIRVAINSENLFDCNYIMFRNTSFGTKWFYAFITQVEYVNNGVSDITFETDVMQTWFYDCTLKHSFVEREHSATDKIGDNLVDEQLELGEYVHKQAEFTNHLEEQCVVVASTFRFYFENGAWLLTDFSGASYANVFSGLAFNYFETIRGTIDWFKELQDRYPEKQDGIVSVFMMPKKFFSENQDVKKVTFKKSKNHYNLEGYIPKNNKLFTHPYNLLYVTNLEGNSAEYNYEDFASSTEECVFELWGSVTCNPEIMLIPTNYKGQLYNYDESLMMKNFPVCAFNTDSYKAWLAQNSGTNSVALAGSAGALATGVATLNPVAITGGLVGVLGTLARVTDASAVPKQARGSQSTSILSSAKIKDFRFSHATIKKERAMMIDNFFTMYGYATKKVKTPNISSRPHWNYVKTIDCNIIGSVPVDSMGKIKSIFDKGVTFWKNGNNVGNYELDNSV